MQVAAQAALQVRAADMEAGRAGRALTSRRTRILPAAGYLGKYLSFCSSLEGIFFALFKTLMHTLFKIKGHGISGVAPRSRDLINTLQNYNGPCLPSLPCKLAFGIIDLQHTNMAQVSFASRYSDLCSRCDNDKLEDAIEKRERA